MKALLKNFVRDESGAALVEYGVALLVVILVGTAGLIGISNDTSAQFTDAATATGAVRTAAGATTP